MSTSERIAAFRADPETAEAIWFFGELDLILAAGERTGDRLAVVEHRAPKGMGTPWHLQSDEETFYLLEGELRFWLEEPDDEPTTATPGQLVFVPRDLPHAFQVASETARWLTISTPAGHERFYRDGGDPAERRTIPPPTTPDIARAEASGRRHGVELLGPPPFAHA